MADQASVSSERSNGRGEGVIGGIAGFGNDVANLAELQAKLAALDFKEARQKALLPLGVVAVGGVVLLGTVPVVLAGVAFLLAPALSIALGWAFVLTGVVAAILTAGAVAFAGIKFSRSFDSFRRSREEFNRNVAWIRTVLAHSGRPAPRRWF
jgi:hypothetical protein